MPGFSLRSPSDIDQSFVRGHRQVSGIPGYWLIASLHDMWLALTMLFRRGHIGRRLIIHRHPFMSSRRIHSMLDAPSHTRDLAKVTGYLFANGPSSTRFDSDSLWEKTWPLERSLGTTSLEGALRICRPLNRNRRRYRWLRLVTFQHEVIESEGEQVAHLGIDLHDRQRPWRSRKLRLYLLEMITVNMRIIQRVHKLPQLQITHLGHHHRQ